MNDPWANVPEMPKITAHQVSRIVELIADYTTGEAAELIATLATDRTKLNARRCSACRQTGTHSRTCPTQGRD